MKPKKQTEVQQATLESAKIFVALLKQLKPKKNGWYEGYTLKDILGLVPPMGKTYRRLSQHYQDKVPPHHISAEDYGLVEIDKQTKPYRYKLKEPKLILRPYQADIINRATKFDGNVLIEAPTGAGKSIIAKEIAKEEISNGGKVLVVAPKITLLNQLADTFKELNPHIIHGKNDYDPKHNIFISTLQTAHRKDLGFEPTLIMIDEVHFAFTGKMLEQLLKDFSGKLVGLSATPYDKNGSPLKGFGLHINDYDLKYMINNDYLVPIRSYAPIKVNLKGIRTTAGDYNIKDLENRFNTIEAVSQVVAVTKEMIQERTQAIVFAVTIKHAQALAEAYNEAGIKAAAMHSQLKKEEQSQIMSDYKKGDIKLLCNPDMLTTGFDHPPTDVCVLARATKSQNLYKQMVGRVLRLSPNKKNAILLDCAGVINDLGMPTDPIEENKHKDHIEKIKKPTCYECGSKRIYRTVKEDKAYKVCAECGNKEEIDDAQTYECEKCGLIYGRNAEFVSLGDTLYLKCGCGHWTPISKATEPTELKEIFSKDVIDIVVNRETKKYVDFVISNFGASVLMRDDFREDIQILDTLIRKNPHSFELHKEYLFKDSYQFITKKRLEQRHKEDQKAKAELEQSHTESKITLFTDAVIKTNEELLKANRATITDETINTVCQQLKESTIVGIEWMTTKRLRNLYHSGKDCNQVTTFIPYITKKQTD